MNQIRIRGDWYPIADGVFNRDTDGVGCIFGCTISGAPTDIGPGFFKVQWEGETFEASSPSGGHGAYTFTVVPPPHSQCP